MTAIHSSEIILPTHKSEEKNADCDYTLFSSVTKDHTPALFSSTSFFPPSFIVEGYPSSAVFINIYDLLEWNEFLYVVGLGAHHVGVQVYGVEFAYGSTESGSGVAECTPGYFPPQMWREQLALGMTSLSKEEVEVVVQRFMQDPQWSGTAYRLMSHNCIHFAEALLSILQPQRVSTSSPSSPSSSTFSSLDASETSEASTSHADASPVDTGGASVVIDSPHSSPLSSMASPDGASKRSTEFYDGLTQGGVSVVASDSALPLRFSADSTGQGERVNRTHSLGSNAAATVEAAPTPATGGTPPHRAHVSRSTTVGPLSSSKIFYWIPPYLYRLQTVGLRFLPLCVQSWLENQTVESNPATESSAV